MDHYRPLLWAHSLSEGSHKPDQDLWRLRDPEVWPGGEVEVSDGADCVSSHHPELVDVPILEVRLVHHSDLDIAVVDRLGVVRPVLVAFLPALLHTPGEHHDGPGVRLPAHPPEVVPGGVEGTLGHDELSLGVETRREVCIYVVGAVLVV